MSEPTLASVAGALGPHDPARLAALAGCLPRPPRQVVARPSAALWLDREPSSWRRGEEAGLGWGEQAVAAEPPSDLRSATARGPAALIAGGLEVHASDSGIAPIYHLRDGGAIYFASTVDALARAATVPLTVDWQAWASILTLGYPVGDRTPFAEIRRLGPGESLVWDGERARHRRGPWRWAEVEPRLSVAEGASEALAAMRDQVGRIAPGRVACQLSGGLDSRLCLGLLAERRQADVWAITADQDFGDDAEQRSAAALAAALAVEHRTVPAAEPDFWADLELLALRTDYQHVRPPWRVWMLPELRRADGPVVDGFGFDTFATPGDRFFTPEALDPAGGDVGVEALWRELSARRRRPGALGLAPELTETLWDAARAELLASSIPLRGHPLRSVLTFYLARQRRGIATESQAVLGTDVPVVLALAGDRAVRAALAIDPAEKRGGRLYDALFERLDPRLAGAPSTRRGGLSAEPSPRHSQSPAVAAALARCLADGPLAPYLLDGKLRAVRRGARGSGRVPKGLLGAAFLHLWWQRYRDRLRPTDPAEALAARVRSA